MTDKELTAIERAIALLNEQYPHWVHANAMSDAPFEGEEYRQWIDKKSVELVKHELEKAVPKKEINDLNKGTLTGWRDEGWNAHHKAMGLE